MKHPISVMIVEDSRVIREFLTHVINSDPRLKVISVAHSGEEALQLLQTIRPDIITVDIRLPGMNGLELTTRIMSEFPSPIVVVASDVDDETLQISMHALKAGALAVVEKPVGISHVDYQTIAQSLCTRLVIMSEVRVIRQRFRSTIHDRKTPAQRVPLPVMSKTRVFGNNRIEALGICASTGGPGALVEVMSSLDPKTCPPILLVQHITPSFTESFTHWLNDSLPNLRVKVAAHLEVPQPATVYVAPAGQHLEVHPDQKCLILHDGPPKSSQKPSGTLLLESMARAFGMNCLGIILTGMGDDGAHGLKLMHTAGAYTIAEDESTAIVFGMPKVAVALGATSEVLPLNQISARVNQLLSAARGISV